MSSRPPLAPRTCRPLRRGARGGYLRGGRAATVTGREAVTSGEGGARAATVTGREAVTSGVGVRRPLLGARRLPEAIGGAAGDGWAAREGSSRPGPAVREVVAAAGSPWARGAERSRARACGRRGPSLWLAGSGVSAAGPGLLLVRVPRLAGGKGTEKASEW